MVYHITDFQDSFLVVEDGQAAEKKLSKQYGNTHHLLTKTTLVGSHQNKRHVTTSYVATPRVAARTATFQCCYCSTISISVSNCFRGLPCRFFICSKFPPFQFCRLEVPLSQLLLSLPVLPLDFSVDSRHYLIVQQTFINCSLFSLVSRLPLRTPATGC